MAFWPACVYSTYYAIKYHEFHNNYCYQKCQGYMCGLTIIEGNIIVLGNNPECYIIVFSRYFIPANSSLCIASWQGCVQQQVTTTDILAAPLPCRESRARYYQYQSWCMQLWWTLPVPSLHLLPHGTVEGHRHPLGHCPSRVR